MRTDRIFAIATAISVLLLSLSQSNAQTATSSFVPEQRGNLGVAPMFSALAGEVLAIVDVDDADRWRLRRFSAVTLEEERTVDLEFPVVDLILGNVGGVPSLIVLGDRDGTAVLQYFDVDLSQELIYPLTFSPNESSRLFSIGDDGAVGIAGGEEGHWLDISVSEHGVPRVVISPLLPFTPVSNADIWLDRRESTMFVNGALSQSLLAVDLREQRVLDQVRYIYGSYETPTSFSVMGWTADLACRAEYGTTFIVVDNQSDMLFLVDYDVSFRSLSIKSIVPLTPQLAPGLVADRLPGTNRLRPAALIGSSCDQSAILIGNRYSPRIVEFTADRETRTLEKVGDLQLTFLPTHILVSEGDEFALAFGELGEVLRLVRGSKDIDRDGFTTREIQKLLASHGFLLGPVDGIVGDQTRRAAELVARIYRVDIDLDGDLSLALDTIRQTLGR